MTSATGAQSELLARFSAILAQAQGRVRIAEGVVQLVREFLGADLVNLWTSDQQGRTFELTATTSPRPQTGEVRMEAGDGLVGRVAQTQELLNLSNRSTHPRHQVFTERDEDGMAACLGIPLVWRGRSTGVLVMHSRRTEAFSAEHEVLAGALCSQLSGVLENARLLELLESRNPAAATEWFRDLDRREHATTRREDNEFRMEMWRGFPAAPGLASGHTLRLRMRMNREQLAEVVEDCKAGGMADLETALASAVDDLRRSESAAQDLVGQELSYILGAQVLLLHDQVFLGEIRRRIESGLHAVLAVHDAIEALVGNMRQASSAYLRERAEDFAQIGDVLVGKLLGHGLSEDGLRGAVVFASSISASELVLLTSRGVAALVTAEGGATSHVSLMARALGLPAVTGVGRRIETLREGVQALVDAATGNVFVNPSAEVQEEYRKVAELEEARVTVGADRSLLGPCRLESGETILVMANVGLLRELPVALESGADGVGLYRTEFPFLMRRDAPTETQQVQVYQRALQELKGLPVTFRTLDLGGDKMAPFLQEGDLRIGDEDNPFLGLRSIRLSLAHPNMFRTQLRALLRAFSGRRGRILFPMISSVEELREVLRQLDLARAELRAHGHDFAQRVDVGVMVEVPAAIELAGHLAKLADFLSVGTNDLLQYTVAVDRGNRRVSSLASAYHPALLTMLSRLAWEAVRAGVPLSICGEMAADPAAALFLAGLRVDVLSMDPRYILRTKVLLRGYRLEELRDLVDRARLLATSSEIEKLLHGALRTPPGHEGLLQVRR